MNLVAAGDALTPEPLRGPHPLGMVSLRTYQNKGDSHALERHLHDGHGAFASDADRLRDNPRIPASGGFYSEADAQLSVDTAVSQDALRIRTWKSLHWRRGDDRCRPFIAERGLGRGNGTNLSREEFEAGREAAETTGVRIVLMPNRRYACGFEVLTAYNVQVPDPDPVPLAPAQFGLAEWTGLTAAAAPLPARAEAEAAIAGGKHVDVCWETHARARDAVADGIEYWSSDIRTWLADPGRTTLTRFYCGASTVGATLYGKEWDDGLRRMTTTPIVGFTLLKDPRAPGGFSVQRAFPSRGF